MKLCLVVSLVHNPRLILYLTFLTSLFSMSRYHIVFFLLFYSWLTRSSASCEEKQIFLLEVNLELLRRWDDVCNPTETEVSSALCAFVTFISSQQGGERGVCSSQSDGTQGPERERVQTAEREEGEGRTSGSTPGWGGEEEEGGWAQNQRAHRRRGCESPDRDRSGEVHGVHPHFIHLCLFARNSVWDTKRFYSHSTPGFIRRHESKEAKQIVTVLVHYNHEHVPQWTSPLISAEERQGGEKRKRVCVWEQRCRSISQSRERGV